MTDTSSSSSKASQSQQQLQQLQQPQQQQMSRGGRSQGGSRNHGRRPEQNRGTGRNGAHDGYASGAVGGTSKSLLQPPPTMIPMEFSLGPASPVSPASGEAQPQAQTMMLPQFGAKAPKPHIPTWLTKVRSELPVSFHREISLFYEQMKATPEEERMRKDVVTRLSALIGKLWPAAKVTLYGSCLTGTCLPMSDVDIVVTVDTPYPPLQVLADALKHNFDLDGMELLTTARVPLIKICDKPTKLVVDITFNQSNGPRNSEAVVELMKKYPATKPLVFVLKYLLYWHALNEVYSGGLGSYALTLMIVSYIQKHSESAKRPPTQEGGESELDLGLLLLGFLKFYGFEFDYETKGISVAGEGSYFSKQERGWFVPDKSYLLALEDPCDTENDVGKCAFNITGVILLFQQAYEQLALPERGTHVSFLSRVMDVPTRMLTVRRTVSAPFKTKQSKKFKKRPNAKQSQNGENTTATTTATATATKTTAPTDADAKGDNLVSEESSSESSSLRSSKDDSSDNGLSRSDDSGVRSSDGSSPKLEGGPSSSISSETQTDS